MQDMVPDYGKVWYDDKAIANIFALTNLVKNYRVTYNSHQDDGFTIHNKRGITKFRRNKQGLCVLNPKYSTKTSILSPQWKKIWLDPQAEN